MCHKEYILRNNWYPVEYSHWMGRFLIKSKEIKGFVIIVEGFHSIDASLFMPVEMCVSGHTAALEMHKTFEWSEWKRKIDQIILSLYLCSCCGCCCYGIYIYTIYRGYCIVLCRGQHVVYTSMNIRDHQL